ncbi:MAG TPA: GNAT family N-acetyltransferase, partial [Candidatus Thermoplasmatota archaeon]|nr:GNAT family N-acetyltransferase [Candidatus Thermoplasmatota archaeon]
MLVRPATPADLPRVVELMRELAAFERLEGPDDAAARRLGEDAFERRRIDVLVGERAGAVVA